jgi:hypothetical protein
LEILRMRHRHHTLGVDGLQLVDHREDRIELLPNFLGLRSVDLDPREARDPVDVVTDRDMTATGVRRWVADGAGGPDEQRSATEVIGGSGFFGPGTPITALFLAESALRVVR